MITNSGRRTILGIAVLLACVSVRGQEILRPGPDGRGLHINLGDMAVLTAGEERDDLPCSVEPLDPKLDYDLNYQAGYVVRVPLASLAGPGNALRMLFRVQPLDAEAEPTYFLERFTVPSITEDAEGEATLPGRYRVGPGRYRVDWLMRDRAERVCAHSWEVEASAVEALESLASSPTAHSVSEVASDAFEDERPVRRDSGRLLRVKLFVNFTPQDQSKVSLNSYDLSSVIGMMRAVCREPSIGTFDVIAYNATDERVIFEQRAAPRIDFPALGQALEESPGGAVDFAQLRDKKSSEKFLRSLFETYVASEGDRPDAYIFLGPKLIFEKNPSSTMLPAGERPQTPFFHVIYDRNPRSYPWRDAVATALKEFGAQEYGIITPRDFGKGLREIMSSLNAATHAAGSVPSSARLD